MHYFPQFSKDFINANSTCNYFPLHAMGFIIARFTLLLEFRKPAPTIKCASFLNQCTVIESLQNPCQILAQIFNCVDYNIEKGKTYLLRREPNGDPGTPMMTVIKREQSQCISKYAII